MVRRPMRSSTMLLLLLSSTFFDSAESYKIGIFEGYDVPGPDMVVHTGDVDPAAEGVQDVVEQIHTFEGYPQSCVDECNANLNCHGFVTVGNNCFYRGGLSGTSAGAPVHE